MGTQSFENALALERGIRRTAAIAAWFQGLYEDVEPPVLVGGGAVELQTRGAYTTGDFDFIGDLPGYVKKALEKAGFMKRGRHWMHERGQIFIEIPASEFDREVRVESIEFDDWTVVVLSPEDLLIDRLAAWKFWKVAGEGVNAFLLWRDRHEAMNKARLNRLAEEDQVADALRALRSFADAFDKLEPDIEEVERWARHES